MLVNVSVMASPIYRCNKCDFNIDLQYCSLKSWNLKVTNSPSFKCATFDKKPGVIECINCYFSLDFECATLPLIARHIYDDHLLSSASLTLLKIIMEYYYLICKEKIDKNYWFYFFFFCKMELLCSSSMHFREISIYYIWNCFHIQRCTTTLSLFSQRLSPPLHVKLVVRLPMAGL